VDADQQDVGYAREESATPNKDENQMASYDQQQEEVDSKQRIVFSFNQIDLEVFTVAKFTVTSSERAGD